MTATEQPKTDKTSKYPEWEECLHSILEIGGTTMVIGGPDVGKTTFTRLLANQAIAAGRTVAVIDGDPGQSEIGPPCCAGLAFCDDETAALSDLEPRALAFIGSYTPAGHISKHITAVKRLADQANDRFLIVDTPGWIQGNSARNMIQSEFDLLTPAHVVGLQRTDELSGILAPLIHRTNCRVQTPKLPAVIASKSPSLRLQRRAMRFAAYFHDSHDARFHFSDVAITGTWLAGGTPVAAHILLFLNNTLGPTVRIYHAETSGRHLGLMTNRPIASNSAQMGVVLETLKAREFTVTVAPRLQHLLVGMEAPNGKLLGLGIIDSLDFRRGQIGLLTPVRAPDAACILHLGMQRIAPDGSDEGALNAGDL